MSVRRDRQKFIVYSPGRLVPVVNPRHSQSRSGIEAVEVRTPSNDPEGNDNEVAEPVSNLAMDQGRESRRDPTS